MITIKSFTDLEQSKKLAEILPLESADMALCSKIQPLMTNYISAKKKFSNAGEIPIDPCWSLAALLSILPEPSLIQNQENLWMLRTWDKKRFPWSVGGYINPIDACYEMIIKLKEQNLL